MKELLRSLRNKNNYSQSAVAEYLEISRQMYNKYENGTAEPSLNVQPAQDDNASTVTRYDNDHDVIMRSAFPYTVAVKTNTE